MRWRLTSDGRWRRTNHLRRAPEATLAPPSPPNAPSVEPRPASSSTGQHRPTQASASLPLAPECRPRPLPLSAVHGRSRLASARDCLCIIGSAPGLLSSQSSVARRSMTATLLVPSGFVLFGIPSAATERPAAVSFEALVRSSRRSPRHAKPHTSRRCSLPPLANGALIDLPRYFCCAFPQTRTFQRTIIHPSILPLLCPRTAFVLSASACRRNTPLVAVGVSMTFAHRSG